MSSQRADCEERRDTRRAGITYTKCKQVVRRANKREKRGRGEVR